jgi:hypothetical protein
MFQDEEKEPTEEDQAQGDENHYGNRPDKIQGTFEAGHGGLYLGIGYLFYLRFVYERVEEGFK